ncbi:hypothetical protein PG995_004638 [Apiospora arundinis]
MNFSDRASLCNVSTFMGYLGDAEYWSLPMDLQPHYRYVAQACQAIVADTPAGQLTSSPLVRFCGCLVGRDDQYDKMRLSLVIASSSPRYATQVKKKILWQRGVLSIGSATFDVGTLKNGFASLSKTNLSKGKPKTLWKRVRSSSGDLETQGV